MAALAGLAAAVGHGVGVKLQLGIHELHDLAHLGAGGRVGDGDGVAESLGELGTAGAAQAERGGVAALRNDFEAGQSALKYGVSVRVQLR